jgi:sulfur-carrier protein
MQSENLMTIKVRYFASLKEYVKKSVDFVEFQANLSVYDVWRLTNPDLELPNNILCSVNMEYVPLVTLLQNEDEVAFFPPVTGG